MKRILAWNCFAFLAAQVATAFLGRAVILLVLGALVAFSLLRQNLQARFCFVLSISMLLGAGWIEIYTMQHERLAESLNGAEITAVAQVLTATPAYGNTSYGTLLLTETDGAPVKIKVSCYGFPVTKPGQRFKAAFQLAKVEKDRLSQYADGIILTAEYHGGYSSLESGNGLFAFFARVRMNLSDGLAAEMDPEQSALVSAMVLGDKSRLTAELRSVFSSAGASHMLVVSGMHLSMLCGVLVGILQAGTFSRRRAFLLATVALLMVGLVGATVSVVRAAVVMLLSCLGLLAVRKTDIITSLSFSALLLCIHCPYAMFDVGFQLTYAATLGVTAAVFLYQFYRRPKGKEKLAPRPKGWRKWLSKAADAVLTAILTGFFATLFTAPFLLLHRMAVSGVSMFSSILAMLFLPGILLLGGGAAVLCFLKVGALAAVLTQPLSILLDALLWALKWLGRLPFAKLSLPREYTIFALFVIAAWAFVMVKWKHTRWFPLRLVAVLLVAGLLGSCFGRNVIEVEEFGSATAPCIMVSQNGHSMLVYRGGQANRAQLQKLLDYRGLTNPEIVIDFRQSGSSQPPEAKEVLLAMELSEPMEGSLTEEIAYYLLPEKKGSLVLLDLGGYRVAMTAGELKENREIPVDIYYAAGKKAYQMVPERIVVNHKDYAWLETASEQIYYGTNPVVSIRPGKSIQYKGVKALAVQ